MERFIETKCGRLVPESRILIALTEPTPRIIAHDEYGERRHFEVDGEEFAELEAGQINIIPAQPGWYALHFDEAATDAWEYPVIAWRIERGYLARPITANNEFNFNDIRKDVGLLPLLASDGSVSDDHTRWPDKKTWLECEAAAAERRRAGK